MNPTHEHKELLRKHLETLSKHSVNDVDWNKLLHDAQALVAFLNQVLNNPTN